MKGGLFLSYFILVTTVVAYAQPVNTWVRITDLGLRNNSVPIDRSGAFLFSIGDKGYLGMGVASDGSYLNDFWEYNSITNTWTQKANPPVSMVVNPISYYDENFNLASFSIRGNGYLKDPNHFYQYDTTLNVWTPKTNVANGHNIINGFALGNKGYVMTDTGLFEYNDLLDSWIFKTGPVWPSWSPAYASSFSKMIIDSTVAFEGGDLSPLVYDKTSNTWTYINPGPSLCPAPPPCAIGPFLGYNYKTLVSLNNKGYAIGSIYRFSGCPPVAMSKFGRFNSFTAGGSCLADYPGTFRNASGGNWAFGLNGHIIAGGYSGSYDGMPYYSYDTTLNSWSNIGAFKPLTGRTNCVTFSIGNKIYAGYNGVFWKLDTLTNEWSKISDIPTGLSGKPVAFSVGGYGYVGGGSTNQFWKYDPTTDTWSSIASYPGGALTGSIAFSIGNYGYVGTGYDGTHYRNNFYSYYPPTNTWTAVANFAGGPRYNAACFVIGNKGYVGTGQDSIGGKQDFWEYDPLGNVWVSKSNFLGGYTSQAVGFSASGKGFIATGGTADMFVYDNTTDTWSPSVSFGGGARISSIGIGIGNTIYLGTGIDYSTTITQNDIWKFIYADPSSGEAHDVYSSNLYVIQPNPTTKNVTITSPENINSVVITNTIGQKVYSGNYSNKQVEIEMAELPIGLYLVKINNNKTYKVIRQ